MYVEHGNRSEAKTCGRLIDGGYYYYHYCNIYLPHASGGTDTSYLRVRWLLLYITIIIIKIINNNVATEIKVSTRSNRNSSIE